MIWSNFIICVIINSESVSRFSFKILLCSHFTRIIVLRMRVKPYAVENVFIEKCKRFFYWQTVLHMHYLYLLGPAILLISSVKYRFKGIYIPWISNLRGVELRKVYPEMYKYCVPLVTSESFPWVFLGPGSLLDRMLRSGYCCVAGLQLAAA